MALLSSRIQVRPGLLHAVIEVLSVSDRPMTRDEVADRLQPEGFRSAANDNPPDVVPMAIDAAIWLGLVQEEDGAFSLVPPLAGSGAAEVDAQLAGHIRNRLLGEPEHTGMGDLALAIGWYLAQDAWAPPRDVSTVEALLREQFPENPEYLNPTKWGAFQEWLQYLGLGTPDPLRPDLFVPDPTVAICDELLALEEAEWSLADLIAELALRCGALDTGAVRRAAVQGIESDQVPWEFDDQVVSPSMALALHRLEARGLLELRREADSPNRRVLRSPTDERLIDLVRIQANVR